MKKILLIVVLVILFSPFPKPKGYVCDFPPCDSYNSFAKILWNKISNKEVPDSTDIQSQTPIKDNTNGTDYQPDNQTNSEINTNDWKSITFNDVTFKYPADWVQKTDSYETRPGSRYTVTENIIEPPAAMRNTLGDYEITYGIDLPYAGANNPEDVMEIKKIGHVYFSQNKGAPIEEKSVFDQIVATAKIN